jgi:hypothetical protein
MTTTVMVVFADADVNSGADVADMSSNANGGVRCRGAQEAQCKNRSE